MPADDSAMGPPSGSSGMPGAPGGKMTSGTDGPTILGLLAFGLMSMLFGLSQLPGPYGSGFITKSTFAFNVIWLPGGTVTGSMITLGGVVLILAALLILFKGWGNFWGVSLFGYGAFWISWSGISPSLLNHVAFGYGTAGFAFLWVLFSLTFLISSMKHGWMTFIFFLVVTIAYILLVVEAWQWGAKPTTPISGFELGAIGGFWILAGIIGWYSGTARLAEYTYGKKVLPG